MDKYRHMYNNCGLKDAVPTRSKGTTNTHHTLTPPEWLNCGVTCSISSPDRRQATFARDRKAASSAGLRKAHLTQREKAGRLVARPKQV